MPDLLLLNEGGCLGRWGDDEGRRQALIASAGTTTRASLSALLAATFLAWNPYVLSIDRLNANVLVLAPCLLLIYLLQRRSSSPLVLGLLLGLIAGIRNEAVCFVPAISLWILWADGSRDVPERLGRLVQVGLWTVVAMLPVFYWKWFAFGHPLMHPSQYPHFQGFRPEFVHSLFGIEFRFNGLFNWPLHDDLVRTPHFGYPTYLLFPLVTLRSLGSLACALILIGLVRAPRRLGLFLVLWMLPVFVLFGPQENWEEVKMTFMLLAWPTFVPASALGLAWITSPDPRRRRLLGLVGLAFALLLLGRGLARVEVPADERWYVRFPKASPGDPDAREGLAEADRNDWLYFQSFESAEEIARERAKLRALWPWPARYLPVALPQPDAIPTMRNEMGARDLQILDIWGYIYGTRK